MGDGEPADAVLQAFVSCALQATRLSNVQAVRDTGGCDRHRQLRVHTCRRTDISEGRDSAERSL